jgi:hypothetical protein
MISITEAIKIDYVMFVQVVKVSELVFFIFLMATEAIPIEIGFRIRKKSAI